MEPLTFESSAVQKYLDILQAVIARMASNSTNAKAWCIGLVSAVIVMVVKTGKPSYVLISLLPVAAFTFIDTYYLGLERRFRKSYNCFIALVKDKKATESDLFVVSPGKWNDILWSATEALASPSIWLFYGMVTAIIFVIWRYIA